MSHPGEELDHVSARISRASETIREIVDGVHAVTISGCNWRMAIDDGHNHRCCCATKMLVPLRGFYEAVGSDEDSFHRLLLVKLPCCPFVKPLISCLAHPTIAEGILCSSLKPMQSQIGAQDNSHIIVMGQSEQKTTRHDVTCDNVTSSIRIYRCPPIE